MAPSAFLAELDRRVLVIDGAMGTSLQSRSDCRTEDWQGRENCSEILTRSRPDMIQQIHEAFLEAGADCIETNTFGANLLVGAEFDDEVVALTRRLNREGAQLARAACAKHETPEKPRFVLGSMGPGTKLVSLGHTGTGRVPVRLHVRCIIARQGARRIGAVFHGPRARAFRFECRHCRS